ncbi:MAG TPA: DUF3443 family protein, partial [Candidatus Acidoferrales bacterium]|nr:DUF3443 family protein [Candidatus Acidoferrales bacterium]
MTAQRGSPPLVMRFLPLAVLLAAGVITLAACASGGGGQLLPPAPEPAVSLRASLSFGPVPEGTTSAPMTVTLTNVGSASLTFTSNPGLSGANAADFAITAATCSTASQVAAGANCTVTLTFKPSTAAGESASLGFADNASPSSQSVALSGGASSSVNNVLAVQVNAGPPAAGGEDVDILFASVTICVPGTANCQTIDNVEVDTGSSGLRLLASQVNIALPQATVGGNPLAECIQFVDTTYGFGSVATADIQMAGEVASSVPIQVLAAPGFTNVPNSCSSGAPADYNLDSVLALGANGLIGVGLFRQDCGQYCNSAPAPSGFYYSCP